MSRDVVRIDCPTIWKPTRYTLRPGEWTRIYNGVPYTVAEIRIENLSLTNTIRIAPNGNPSSTEYSTISPGAVRYETFNPPEIWAYSPGLSIVEIDVRGFEPIDNRV